MYKILIVCRDENMKNEIDSFLKGSYRTVILADDILQAEIISRTIRINFFIMVSAECYDSIRMIKAIKNNCLYKFTPIAVLNYSKGFNEDLKGYSFLYHCHRSYIINTENILRIDKTLPAWEIYFYGCNKTALVSRQNKREFAGKLTCQQESRPL